MNEYTINLSDEQVEYFQNLDTQSLVDDLEKVVNLIDSLNIDNDEIVYE